MTACSHHESSRLSAVAWRVGLLAGLILAGGAPGQNPPDLNPPEPSREFRGAWVATVANINWPSKPGLSVTDQKAELLGILDTARDNNFNAILLQVRPACDALYPSELEPWSEYLTGKMGQAPSPLYDPLEFAVSAAHRRGLELHAWINPFRALHHSAKSPVSANHISKRRPELVHRYNNYLWLDPGMPAAREHSKNVILDVVRRYDIDGIHFDDYFYPYPERDARGGTLPFPDRDTWQKYGAGLSRGDWRRRNVDQFIQEVREAVHAEKRWVQFGISPFGIWRPGYPKPIQGLDAYNTLYADARKWLRQGWVDYMVPQLYWSIDSPGQAFPVLLEWWEEQNAADRHLWIGLNTVKAINDWPASEILNQVKLTRQFGLDGQVHYHIGALQQDRALANQLKAGVYRQKALPPPSPWLDDTPPPRPQIEIREGTRLKVSWTPGNGEAAASWVLQSRTTDGWTTEILPAATRDFDLSQAKPREVVIRAADRCGNLSAPARLTLRR